VEEREEEVLVRTLMEEFEKFAKLSKKVPSEVSNSLTGIEELNRLADTMASHLELKVPESRNCWSRWTCASGSRRFSASSTARLT